MRFRQTLFWDVDPKTINSKKHARYIIERVLDFGHMKEVIWLWHYYSRKLIADVVRKPNNLTPKSLNFWNLIVDDLVKK